MVTYAHAQDCDERLCDAVCVCVSVQATALLVKVLSKAMDTSLATDKLEVATLTRDASGKVG